MSNEEILNKYYDIFNEIVIKASKSDMPEDYHNTLDEELCNLLKELGFGVIVDLYESVHKWYD